VPRDRMGTRQEHERGMGMGDHGGNGRTRGIEWGTDADKGCAFITPQSPLKLDFSHDFPHNKFLGFI